MSVRLKEVKPLAQFYKESVNLQELVKHSTDTGRLFELCVPLIAGRLAPHATKDHGTMNVFFGAKMRQRLAFVQMM
jgi:hypothetical protein